ncbi:MAG: hypothetical protein ACNS61_00180 [Candidatus Wenzhouxiangella sp. M2_3B_020]
MPEGFDHRLELALEENKVLREQIAEVQQAFEHRVLYSGSVEVPEVPEAEAFRPIPPTVAGGPSSLVRHVRCRLADVARAGKARRAHAGPPRSSRRNEPPSEASKRREWARLRAELALAEEKSSKSVEQVRQAEAALAQLRIEHQRCEEQLRGECKRLTSAVEALKASQKLVRHLERLVFSMEAWLSETSGRIAQLYKRLKKTEEDLDSERSLRQATEEARRADADHLLVVTEKLHQAELQVESERDMRRTEEQARNKVTKSLDNARATLEQAERELESERESRRAADQGLRDAAESLDRVRDRLQGTERELESERHARRAAEQAGILDAENLNELRERFAEMTEKLSERDRLIDRLGAHLDAASASAQRLISDSEFSTVAWSELAEELRERVDDVNPDDA